MPHCLSQVKFTIDSDIVADFKARCASQGCSMTAAVRRFMSEFAPITPASPNFDTRPHRKAAVADIVQSLLSLLRSEESYRDAIPEQFTSRFDAADNSCDCLEQAISCLQDAY